MPKVWKVGAGECVSPWGQAACGAEPGQHYCAKALAEESRPETQWCDEW